MKAGGEGNNIVGLKPSGVITNTFPGLFGAPNAAVALQSGDDDSYIRGDTGDACLLDMEDLDGTDKRIAAVRQNMKIFTSDEFTVEGQIRTHAVNYVAAFSWSTTAPHPGKVFYGAWFVVNPNTNDEWTFTELSNINARLEVLARSGPAGQVSIRGTSIQVDVRNKPRVFVTRPNTFHKDASFPVRWGFDANGDAQSKYRVKVFSSAVAEGGGFDPDTSTYVYDSRPQPVSGAPQHTIPSGVLSYDTHYYIFVQGSSLFPGANGAEEWWSDWDGVQIKTFSQPVVNITSPGSITNEAQPDFTYTITDDDNQGETNTKLRIYRGDGTGVNPDRDKPLLEINTTGGTGIMSNTSVYFVNGATYTVFARTSTGRIFSAWDSQTFQVVTDASNPPTITPTADPTHARITLALGFTAGDTPPVVGWVIERSVDNGVTWDRVRNGYRLSSTAIGGSTATIQDYEAPFNTPCKYRAFTIGGAPGGRVASAYTTQAGTTTLTVNVVWVKAISDPSAGMHMLETDTWLTRKRRKRRAFYEPLGREKPVGFREPGKGEVFTMGFIGVKQADLDAFEAIIDTESTILVQSPRKQWYAEVSEDFGIDQSLWDELHSEPHINKYAVTFKEVSTPDVDPI